MADGIAFWGSNFEGRGGKFPPICRAQGPSSNYNFTWNGGTFKIPFTQSPSINHPQDNFDESQSRFIAPFAGYYYFSWNVCVQCKNGDETDDLGLSLRDNNNIIVNYEQGFHSWRGTGTAFGNYHGSCIYYCGGGDQMELYATTYGGYGSNTGADGYCIGSGTRTNFNVFLLGVSGP